MYKTLAIVAVSIGLIVGAYFYGYSAGGDAQRAADAAKTIEAVDIARKEEQANQEKVNVQTQLQLDEMSRINGVLNADIIQLRQRPDRRHVPDNSEADCEGSTGANLSAPDAEFLTREAARADILRAALKSCYKYADTVGVK